MTNLEPKLVWDIFDQITRVPRPSKKEGKIIEWLVGFAEKHNLEYRKDKVGNVVITRPASRGMESAPTVVLQNHVDMVCEKNSGVDFDFDSDAIQTYIEDGWVKARGTTLGADNGFGMAAALAVLIDDDVVCPTVEALFTVDEETGLTGAFNLGEGMITGKYLINLDSEDEGEVFIGCAGGVDTLAYFDFRWEDAPAGYEFFEVSIGGLKGGHSGDDIEKGRGNSNKILARLLYGFPDLRLATIDGGNLRNAIPREARAVVGVRDGAGFKDYVESFSKDVKVELAYSDGGVTVEVKPATARRVIDSSTVGRLIEALLGVQSGVLAMSFAMPGLVETSSNLASVKIADDRIVVTTSQRSSLESSKWMAAWAVESVFALAGARVEHSEGYPGWAPNPESPLLAIVTECYRKLFHVEQKVRAIHAGLECGLFLEKFPGLDMVSFGPTILGAHSPDERLEIASVERFWKLLIETLRVIR